MLRVATLLACSLVAGCLPAEVVRNKAGVLAFRTKRGIAVLTPEAKEPRVVENLLGPGEKCEPVWLAWSPDGKRLAFTCGRSDERSSLAVLEVATGAVRVLATEKAGFWFPRWSPGSTSLSWVATGPGNWDDAYDARLKLLDLATGRGRVLARRCGLWHAWAPDGKSIAAVTTEQAALEEPALGALVRLDPATGESETLARLAFSPFLQVEFHPDGKSIRFATGSGALPAVAKEKDHEPPMALFSFDLKERTIRRLSREDENVGYEAFSPSGRRSLRILAKEDELLEGEVQVRGEGLDDPVDLGPQTGQMLPFWMDEDRIGMHRGGRIVVHDLRTGRTEDATARFAGIVLSED